MNKQNLLYHYFSNSLTSAQKEEFQILLQTDEEFKEQFEFENNLKSVAKENRHQGLKSKLNNFEANINTKKITKNASFSYLKIAASVVVLVTAGWFAYQNIFKVDYTNIYNENYKTYPNTVYAITRSDTINSLEREAFVAYDGGYYNLAIEKFNKAKAKDYFEFYKAQSYIQLEQYDKAKVSFKKVVEKNGQFVPEAYWYMALISIKQKDKTTAIYYLNQLNHNFNYKKDETRQLIERLE